jgi:hypothetical protein
MPTTTMPTTTMPTTTMSVVMVVDGPQPHQLLRTAIIIAIGPNPVAVPVDRRIGIARAGWFGTGRHSDQQGDRREESKPTHGFDVVGLGSDGKIAG